MKLNTFLLALPLIATVLVIGFVLQTSFGSPIATPNIVTYNETLTNEHALHITDKWHDGTARQYVIRSGETAYPSNKDSYDHVSVGKNYSVTLSHYNLTWGTMIDNTTMITQIIKEVP